MQILKDLKAEGLEFCGPTIVYAFTQAMGMVNDHLVGCFCHSQVAFQGFPAVKIRPKKIDVQD